MSARYVMNIFKLSPGEKNVLHSHPASEDSLFLLAGSGWVHDLDASCAFLWRPGARS